MESLVKRVYYQRLISKLIMLHPPSGLTHCPFPILPIHQPRQVRFFIFYFLCYCNFFRVTAIFMLWISSNTIEFHHINLAFSFLGDNSSIKGFNDEGRPFSTVRPPDHEIESLFDKMLTRRGIHDRGARSVMLAFPAEKKWLMVSQDKQADATTTVRPTMSTSASSRKSALESKELDKGTPEYYIKQFLEPDFRGINPKILAHLAVSLRTMPLRCVIVLEE